MVRRQKAFLPDAQNHALYERIYREVYLALYPKMRPMYRKMRGFLEDRGERSSAFRRALFLMQCQNNGVWKVEPSIKCRYTKERRKLEMKRITCAVLAMMVCLGSVCGMRGEGAKESASAPVESPEPCPIDIREAFTHIKKI